MMSSKGFGFEVGATSTDLNWSEYGKVYAYFPGFHPRHGLKVSAAVRHYTMDTFSTWFADPCPPAPRGLAKNAAVEALLLTASPLAVKVSLDYAMPIFPMDFAIGNIFYFRNFEVVPFADLTFLQPASGYRMAGEELWSAGADIAVNLQRIVLISGNFSIGARLAYSGGPAFPFLQEHRVQYQTLMNATCSRCGESHAVATYPSINVAADPDLKARVRDGSLFVWECPHCGARNLLKYQTLYHDPAEKLMVWLLPGDAEPPQAVADAVRQLDGYTLRLVREVGDLVEKVNIHACGLDDVLVEMCKYVTRLEMADQQKRPEIQDAPLKFFKMDGPDNDLVFSFPLDGEMKVVNVGFHVYEDARGILGRHPDVRPEPGFARVDAAWLGQYFR